MHALFRQNKRQGWSMQSKKNSGAACKGFETALDAPIIACADQSIARYGNVEALGRSSGRRSARHYTGSFVGEAGACVQ